MSPKTPQTQKEFIDYRFNETNENIADVKKTLDEVQTKLNNTFATKDYVDTRDKGLDERVNSLENDRKWLVRLILGYVVFAIFGVFLYVKGAHP